MILVNPMIHVISVGHVILDSCDLLPVIPVAPVVHVIPVDL